MTDEDINSRIAEACGWTRYVVDNADADGPIMNGKTMVRWTAPGEALNRNPYWSKHSCPDYVNDLNAMHEAEKILNTAEQQNSYYGNIAEITWGCEETGHRQVVFNQLTASARQRAEAFLRTLKLWKPS